MLFPTLGAAAVKKAVARWRGKGWIRLLKRGVYELTYPGDLHIPDFYIANQLYRPSYISLETALSYYSVIPEVAMAVTSLTTKPTRRFKNAHGLFLYRTVDSGVFTGYYVESVDGYPVFIAEPEKALADFFYFKTYRRKSKRLTGERLDREVISRLDAGKVKGYLTLYGIHPEDVDAYL